MSKETKVLGVDAKTLTEKLDALGAKKVFDAIRTITYFQNPKDSKEPFLKLTEEGDKLKLSSQDFNTRAETKLFVSRKKECVELLKTLGYVPVSEVKARRISYEWEGIDCESKYMLQEILQKLSLEKNETGEMSTPEIYKKYKLDYFVLFKL